MKNSNFFFLLRCDLQRLGYPSTSFDGEQKIQKFQIFNPRFFPVVIIRLSNVFYKYKVSRVFSYLLTWLNLYIFGIESTPKCQIGRGLLIPHSVGIVNGASTLGHNVTLFQSVTLGALEADMSFKIETRPKVGNNVILGAGCKVLGNITIGNNVTIGANAVVLTDVPDNSIAVGIPAKIMKKEL